MKVKIINNKKELKKFINMPDSLYKGDKLYVPYMKSDLFKNLNKLVLIDKTYTALVVEENNKYIARVLFTIHYSKQLKLDRCGFFSMFESINNHTCVKLLFDEVKKQLKNQNISYLEGTFYPYDQDNRRGIQISGFDDEPLIFTSYNKDYYKDLLEEYGFKKDFGGEVVELMGEFDLVINKYIYNIFQLLLLHHPAICQFRSFRFLLIL